MPETDEETGRAVARRVFVNADRIETTAEGEKWPGHGSMAAMPYCSKKAISIHRLS